MAGPRKTVQVDILRSQLGRVRGLGAARAGSGHWWMQRLTSIALVPLTLWFICAVIRLEGASRADVAAWLHAPVPLVLMLCLIVATFWHLELGLRVVIEDYVHRDAVTHGAAAGPAGAVHRAGGVLHRRRPGDRALRD